jgi:hypothetical protein
MNIEHKTSNPEQIDILIEHLYVRAYWSAWQGIAPEQIRNEQMPFAVGMYPFINRADAVKIIEDGIEAGIKRMHKEGKGILQSIPHQIDTIL